MSDIFGDQYPFTYSNPLQGAKEHRLSCDGIDNIQVQKRFSIDKKVKGQLVWGTAIALGVAACHYIAQQHGPRPTLQPVETIANE